MDYEEEKDPYQSLYDAVGKTVNKMYEGIENYVCDSCHEPFMSDRAQCPRCGSWNTRKI